MYSMLIELINENGLLYKYQFGFQKGKSTSMALVTLIDKITEVLDKRECIIGVFLDFSKAFDTVDHGILLQKLELCGLQDITLKWFKDYLSNRIQYVIYNGIKSMTDIIKCGVPQGSILGPLLFLIYINDLCQVSEFFLAHTQCFIDLLEILKDTRDTSGKGTISAKGHWCSTWDRMWYNSSEKYEDEAQTASTASTDKTIPPLIPECLTRLTQLRK